MSNAVLNAHIQMGEPCGEDAGLSEIAEWAGEFILSGNGGLAHGQIALLRDIGEFLITETPEPGQRELALEAYYKLYDGVTGR